MSRRLKRTAQRRLAKPRRTPFGFRGQFERLEDRRMLFVSYAPIQAFAYIDANGDGRQNLVTEPALPGVTIRLTDTAGTNFSLQTNSQGIAKFGPNWPVAVATLTVTNSLGYLPSAAFHGAIPPEYGEGPLFGATSLTFVNANYRTDLCQL